MTLQQLIFQQAFLQTADKTSGETHLKLEGVMLDLLLEISLQIIKTVPNTHQGWANWKEIPLC